MSDRRNFMLDDDAAELLDEHPDDNHSEIVRELLKEYYTVGVFDTEEAAVKVRKRELERQREQINAEREAIEEELSRLDELESDDAESDVEAIASELNITADMATADNPAIQKRAKQNGIDPAVLAEEVEQQARERQRQELASLS